MIKSAIIGLIILGLLSSIGIGVYLTQQRTNLKSRAAGIGDLSITLCTTQPTNYCQTTCAAQGQNTGTCLSNGICSCTNTSTTPFSKSSPTDVTTVSKVPTTFSWTAQPGAQSYEFRISLDTAGSNVFFRKSTTSTSVSVDLNSELTLGPGNTYYWQVVGFSNSDLTGTQYIPNDPPWSMIVSTAPPPCNDNSTCKDNESCNLSTHQCQTLLCSSNDTGPCQNYTGVNHTCSLVNKPAGTSCGTNQTCDDKGVCLPPVGGPAQTCSLSVTASSTGATVTLSGNATIPPRLFLAKSDYSQIPPSVTSAIRSDWTVNESHDTSGTHPSPGYFYKLYDCNNSGCAFQPNTQITLPAGTYKMWCDYVNTGSSAQDRCSGDPVCSYSSGGTQNCTLVAASSCGTSSTASLTVNNPTGPTCSDGIKNGNETGVDCGSSCPNSCPSGPKIGFTRECKIGDLSGRQYCVGNGGGDDSGGCWTDESQTARGCKIDPTIGPVSLSCAPDPAQIGVNANASWKIRYNSSLSLIPTVNISNDANLTNKPITSPTIVNGAFESQIQNITYPTAGTYTPTVSLIFGTPGDNQLGQTPPLSCTSLIVGQSTLRASLTLSASTLKTNQELTLTGGATETATGDNAYITGVSFIVVNKDGTNLSAQQCGTTLTADNKCQIFSREGLTFDKTVSGLSAKWTPKIAGNYVVYAKATSSTGNTCSGARKTEAGAFPCGNASSQDLQVTDTLATVAFRLSEDPVAFNKCALPKNFQSIAIDLNNSNQAIASQINPYVTNGCPTIFKYGNNPSVVVSNFPTDNHWTSPGQKTIFVQFIKNDGTFDNAQKTIELVAPDPQITQVSCSLDLNGKGINVSVSGKNFGDKNSANKLTVGETDAKISQWNDKQITATLANPSIDPEIGTTYPVIITRPDGAKIDNSCTIGVSTLSVGTKFFCRSNKGLSVANVDAYLVEAKTGGRSVHKTVTIDQSGTVQGLNNTLQAGACYKLSLKAPKSIRKTVEFQAGQGTTVIPDFHIAIGDIFPSTGDGKINSLDRAEIIREWNASDSSVRGIPATQSGTLLGRSSSGSNTNASKPGDFNQDGLINTFDFSCMLFDFNAEDSSIPTPGPVGDKDLQAQCSASDTDNSGCPEGQILINGVCGLRVPAGTAQPSPS